MSGIRGIRSEYVNWTSHFADSNAYLTFDRVGRLFRGQPGPTRDELTNDIVMERASQFLAKMGGDGFRDYTVDHRNPYVSGVERGSFLEG